MDKALLVIAIIEAIIIIGLVVVMVFINRSQKRIMERASLIVKGKLDVEDIKTGGDRSNSTVIANAFNSIKTNLMTFVESTKANVVTLADAVDDISQSAENNRRESEKIASDVTNATTKTAEQLGLVRDNLEAIEQNNTEMQEIDREMVDIRQILDGTVDSSRSGLANLEGYERDMDAMSIDLSNINDILLKFNEDIKKIEEVGDFIIGISGKLRLLALNASVETARAGEAGKGFAVVAREVNGISVKTREGMDTINQIVKEIISSSQQVNDSILNCERTFGQSKDTFAEVNGSFRSINDRSLEIQNKMMTISSKFDNMAANSEISKQKAESLLETSQSISENISEIATVSRRVASESNTLSENTEALFGMMSGIERLIGQYHTAIIPVKDKPRKPVRIITLSMFDNDFWYGVRRGALYAKKELAAKNSVVEYIPIPPGSNMNQIFLDAVLKATNEHYDGLIFPGFLGGATDALIDAANRGVKLMTYNCDIGGDEIRRVSCLKPDPMEPGLISAKAVEKYLGKRGNIVLLVGDLSVGSNVERRDAFVKYIDSCPHLHILEEVELGDTAEDVTVKTKEALSRYDNIDAMMITTGNPIAAAKAIEDARRGNRTKLFTFDSNPEILAYIKKGIIGTTVTQDAFGQGHDSIIWLYNHIVGKIELPEDFIPCRISVIDENNVDSLIL